jgi:hypothetical protein
MTTNVAKDVEKKNYIHCCWVFHYGKQFGGCLEN